MDVAVASVDEERAISENEVLQCLLATAHDHGGR
jgi:hypothetical protein